MTAIVAVAFEYSISGKCYYWRQNFLILSFFLAA